ncbi:MAG: Do family serine endopeptidase [Reyranellaceae bacterium]
MSAALVAGLLIAAPAVAQQVPAGRDQLQLSFAPLVKRVSPAVVNIYARTRVKQEIPPFLRFFPDEFLRQLPQERVAQSLGSGVIVRQTGLIVTNNHVVRGATEINVVLADRREFAATVLATDERYDLALLKLDGEPGTMPFLELRDSDTLEVGDLVLAIGNPFGLNQTVTSGIISALARSGSGVTENGFFIQTDAAINPGNSGGALVAMDGRLIGINTAIFSRSGGSIGIGFATPSNIVARMIDAGEKGRRMVRCWIGAAVQRVTADIATSLNLSRPHGVILRVVAADGPAGKAGLRVGDVILTINEQPVDDESAMRFRLATLPVDSVARVRVLSRGEERTVEVKLTAPPETPPRDRSQLSGRNPLAGVTVMNMSPAVADELGVNAWTQGVVVAEIAPGAPIGRVMRPGDYIVSVNGEPIDSVASLRSALGGERPGWSVTVRRKGEERTFTFRG